jgi:rSAM/selenodomain-associated transferase 2
MNLSIVIPALNEAAILGTALARLQSLRARGVEIIVVDGGSQDSTCLVAAPLATRVASSPRGRAKQMNAGAAIARGDALLFLHADSILPTDADWHIECALAETPRQWGRFDVLIAGGSTMLPVIAWFMNHRSRLTGIATGDQGIFVTRAAFDAVGGFPDQPLMEDVALSGRLLGVTKPSCLVARITTSGRRWEQHGVWRTIFLMWRLRWRYWRGADPAALHRIYYAAQYGN